MKRYFEHPPKHAWRRRAASALLVLGLLGALKVTYDVTPREQPVQLLFAEALRANLRGVRLTYLEDGEAVSGSEQRFLDGAPAVVDSRPTLSPGNYQLDVELAEQGGSVTHHLRNVTVPTAGTVRIRFGASP